MTTSGHHLMKTKDEGAAWLRSHGWIQCDRGWSKPGVSQPITEKQATAQEQTPCS